MRRLHHLLTLPILLAALTAGCSIHSLDYLNAGYTADPPLPPEVPARVDPPDAAVSPDTLTAGDRAAAPSPPADRPLPSVDTAPPPPDAGPIADAAPASPREVFLIVGALPASAADAVLERHMRSLGLRVTTVEDDVLGTVDTALADLIVISATVQVMNVGARFRDVAKPVLVGEPLLYDDMGMVSTTVNMGVNRGLENNVTSLSIVTPASQLAASLSGNVAIATQATTVSWGVPNASAIRVASLIGMPIRVALFAYETGQRMPELTAPARRVGLFLSDQSASVLSPQGFALLDAAITWALAR
jgi:hypothetical protein